MIKINKNEKHGVYICMYVCTCVCVCVERGGRVKEKNEREERKMDANVCV